MTAMLTKLSLNINKKYTVYVNSSCLRIAWKLNMNYVGILNTCSCNLNHRGLEQWPITFPLVLVSVTILLH